MKANLTAFAATALAWAVIGIALNVSLGLFPFSAQMVISGLTLGAIVAASATLVSLAFGGVRNLAAFVLTAGVMSGALYFGMSMLEFNDGHLLPSLISAGFGLVSAGIGGTVARKVHRLS